MRTFDLTQRIDTSLANCEALFDSEYAYYTQHNVFPFEWDAAAHSAIYRRLNVQVLVTKKCPFSCSFCVERLNPVGNEHRDETRQIVTLCRLIEQLRAGGIEPTVSLTGGEPTLFPCHLALLESVLNRLNVPYNVNTAGCTTFGLHQTKRINLSVHGCFGCKRDDYWNDPTFKNATIQTVLQSNDFDSFINFLDSFDQKRYSFRFPTDTDGANTVCWQPLLNRVLADARFKFVQQKIGDYYFYEEYKYGGKTIRFSFSSLRQLAKYKQLGDGNNVRAVVILPDGSVQFDWIAA